MRLKALGTGSPFCRHPLLPSSWLIQSEEDLVIVGAPWGVIPALERQDQDLSRLSIVLLQSSKTDQVAGLIEMADMFRNAKKKPILAAPAPLIKEVRDKIEPEIGFFLDESFIVKSVVKVLLKEKYYSEEIVFVPNYLDPRSHSYALRFEMAKVFITGETRLNEDWLYKELGNDLILHSCSPERSSLSKSPKVSELQALPMYLQSKIWIYGYGNEQKNSEQPFPMLFLQPNSCVFDSSRKYKAINKERFIDESARKITNQQN